MYVLKELLTIIATSLLVSVTAVAFSTIVGVPIGLYLARKHPRPNLVLLTFLNTTIGLPPVVVGLFVYLLFFSRGILAFIDILFTPLGMIVAQIILTLPIVIAITRSSVSDLPDGLPDFIKSLGASKRQQNQITWNESRQGVLIGIISAFGRAFSEVGAIIIVGGNLKGHTRVLTTAIVTETSKGEYEFALYLGLILVSISFLFTFILSWIQIRRVEK